MKKVYIVTVGEYSDYHIEAVFSNEEKASKYIKVSKIHPSDVEIEEYEIDKPMSDFLYTEIRMKRNGDISRIQHFANIHALEGFYNYTIDNELKWIVKTDDEKRAIKVTNEKRSQIIVAECWGDNKKTRELFNK